MRDSPPEFRHPPGHTITHLLQRWSAGDVDAIERVLPLLYDELRRLARAYFRRERPDHTLQPTAVVHEAFLRLAQRPGVPWQSRAHFVGLLGHVMRRVLVDHAREHGRGKRGGGWTRVAMGRADGLAVGRPGELLALDDALLGLAEIDPQKAAVVELRYFGGLTEAEVAEVLGVSATTVHREWRRARAWLHRELGPLAGRSR
jgi:RNA polymerase sigma factor (TIGR02999 family)